MAQCVWPCNINKCVCSFSHGQLFVTPQTVASQALLSMEFSRQHGLFQARILEWAAIFYSRGSSWHRDWTRISCLFQHCQADCQCRRHKRHGFNSRVGKIPWKRAWQPTPVFLPGESHGQRSLADYILRVATSQTQLKRLSTISIIIITLYHWVTWEAFK